LKTVPKATDLVTTRKDTIAGFRWQAKEKAARGAPFYEIAKYFRANCSKIKSLDSIYADQKLYNFARGAAALSAKSASQLANWQSFAIFEPTISRFTFVCLKANYTSG
jgi:hypothetical protein